MSKNSYGEYLKRNKMAVKNSFHGRCINPNDAMTDLSKAKEDYEFLLLTSLGSIIDRFEASPNYNWIDTKFDILTGIDFPHEDLIKGRSAVYGWVQGRGIETLAIHAKWLEHNNRSSFHDDLKNRCGHVIARLSQTLHHAKKQNGGHCFFLIDQNGNACRFENGIQKTVTLTEMDDYNFSDMFCAKGLYAAGCYLQNTGQITSAQAYCQNIIDSLWSGRFKNDQLIYTIGSNAVGQPAGSQWHAPFTIAIGIANLFAENGAVTESLSCGLKIIDHVINNHLNLGRWDYLTEFDFVEFLDDKKQPYESPLKVYCDPGHVIEFVGLATKFLHLITNPNNDKNLRDKIDYYFKLMPRILKRNFENGYNVHAQGISKLVDLVNKKPLNPQLPWWSLPETMRAALKCAVAADDMACISQLLKIYAVSHNAFIEHYVQPDVHCFGIQQRSPDGTPAIGFPAFPDADLSYHTGLCILDCLTDIDLLLKKYNTKAQEN